MERAGATNDSRPDLARDFFGNECKVQPQGNELLVLSRSPFSSGCDKQDFTPQGDSKPDIDVLNLYKESRPAVVYFRMHGTTADGGKVPAGKDALWGGSGFVVDNSKDSLLIVTDNHVVAGVPDQHVKVDGMQVLMSDGKSYEGKVVATDKARDLALVEIKPGQEKSAEYHAVKLPDLQIVPGSDTALVTFGQPYTSGAIYTSQGSADRIQKRSDLSGVIKPLPDEDPSRDILTTMVPVREGFSGAAVFDRDGTAVAVVDIGNSPFTSVATPITKAIVEDMKAHRF